MYKTETQVEEDIQEGNRHVHEAVMFGLYPVCRVLSLEVVEYSLSCRVLTLVYFSKLVEYSPESEYSSSGNSV